MNELVFQYSRDDAPNNCGPLGLQVRAYGFTASCETYVSEQWLVDLGMKLRAYPIPNEGISDDAMIGNDVGFAITVSPNGSLGKLMIKLKVYEIALGRFTQQAELHAETEYSTIDRFSRELAAAAKAGLGEARLALA